MARARGRQPTFDRDEALETALDLFWRHGYDGVSIADLTKAIGIAAASLYHAFGSKADLYREVLRHYRSVRIGAKEIADATSSYDAVRQMLDRGIAAVTMPGKPLGCMVSSGMLMTSEENADLAAELKAIRTASRKALERRIARDIKEGILPATTNAAALARFYMTVLQGLSVQALDGASAAELRLVAASALRAWPGAPSDLL
ncbi:Transcriptional regulator, TetR family [Bradyrhizobium sp. STM 3843]|uniref:TetR/AcrR family transcriptional regulator n=1 Tax=Bradyrhizobium sp. STM 3843 TaxID=551947 RepID=UPI0002403DAF|nr:TetR/AcrR family transcriptional regulator [Bradyrhizobium sp. STM 3843]CCE12173.1 Transcriptional regulator, TetR family [Bradyrhizobium sp. STM 3843]